ncbi:MAG TPA: transcriptional regulator/antitoxin, MazE [Candidatus Hydrogenedentes bacterium]|nr:transcriptional regulator/antitoxin, MazE [Candidatus Hydrogenedentota bacterium]HPG66817.1 transcriptional regulator/antitoxin, MazE [Candidatus Hydrogenedentota bacterium]
MVTRIQKWGNSQGLRIARDVLESAQVGLGDEVEVAARDGTITPVKRVRGRRNLGELLAQIPEGYQAEEVDWGSAQGSIDFHARDAKRIGKASSAALDEVLSILDACIY